MQKNFLNENKTHSKLVQGVKDKTIIFSFKLRMQIIGRINFVKLKYLVY